MLAAAIAALDFGQSLLEHLGFVDAVERDFLLGRIAPELLQTVRVLVDLIIVIAISITISAVVVVARGQLRVEIVLCGFSQSLHLQRFALFHQRRPELAQGVIVYRLVVLVVSSSLALNRALLLVRYRHKRHRLGMQVSHHNFPATSNSCVLQLFATTAVIIIIIIGLAVFRMHGSVATTASGLF